MFEPGKYWAKLIGGETTVARTGTNQVNLYIEVTHSGDGENWYELSEPVNRTIYLYLTDNAFKYTKENLASVGFNGDFGDGMAFADEPKSVGFQVECAIENYQGKDREKWSFPRGGGEPTPAGADVIRTLNAKWKSGSGKPAPLSKPTQPKPAHKHSPPVNTAPVASGGAPIPDDDIPF